MVNQSKFKPCVLICSHERKEITTENIKALLNQSVKPHIVLIVSESGERNYYKAEFPTITISLHPNQPLGSKFQFGVKIAKIENPDLLIVTGSDDILGKDFVKNACEYLQTNDVHFVGLKQWFIYHEEVMHLYEYMPNIPLGTRIYSKQLLDKLDWKLFDTMRNRLLDDYGFIKAQLTGLNMVIIRDVMGAGLNVVSVKGSWPMLNPYSKMKNHPNCKLIKSGYDPKGIL